jgi:tetratricopeptide (TPR) repeat protein/two-component sensor histidine kinase
MFSSAEIKFLDTVLLEQRLAQQDDPLQRLALIDQLIGHYAYTNVLRAQELLEEQFSLLQANPVPDFLDNYYLNKGVVENQLYAFEKAEATALEAIAYLEEQGSAKQLVELYIDYAGVCINLEKLEEADKYLTKAHRLLRSFPDRRLSSRLQVRRGYMSLHYGNYGEAIEQFLEANQLLGSLENNLFLKDEYFRTLIHSGLGQVYERNDEHEKSARAYLKVVRMCERLHMTNRLAWHYLNVGRAYLATGESEAAKAYFQRVIDTRDDLSLHARASAYANLGMYHGDIGEYEEALRLFDRAESLHRELNEEDYHNLGLIADARGRLLVDMGKTDAALEQLEMALQYAAALEDHKQLAEICREIASLYAEQEDYKNAYLYQANHDHYMEQYIAEVDHRQQVELEVKYEAARRQREAELYELRATQLQLKALRAQMNPHFLYNALNSIQSYITSKDPSAAARYLAKFAKLMRQSLEYSDLEIISLEKELEFLEDYLYINEKLRFDDRLSYRIIVDEELEEDILGVPTMIVQPYVENALEHGLRSKKDGLITVHFQALDDDTILCVVEDNGIGRARAREMQLQDPAFQNHRSRGTSITERRLDILHQSKGKDHYVRTIDLVDDETGKALGTRVEVKIPIMEIPLR